MYVKLSLRTFSTYICVSCALPHVLHSLLTLHLRALTDSVSVRALCMNLNCPIVNDSLKMTFEVKFDKAVGSYFP